MTPWLISSTVFCESKPSLAYKIYTEVIRDRLERETEEKGLLPESQSGFRKGKSTVDNIFVLNHVVQREMGDKNKEERVYTFFADLKAAFDKMDRQTMWDTLRKLKIEEKIVRILEKIYEETEVTIRTNQGNTF
ncbi:uncharacterized protein LOC105840937 [Monomorium pharaonis]|uniref:uncharacterized protein LOC105840937 n=1 Tax=Monomorium pharaonis TaxID=307658 RepID=UPI00174645A2|nr:uncharacterized protein LOC105840937 [Monomorium pharaonis]